MHRTRLLLGVEDGSFRPMREHLRSILTVFCAHQIIDDKERLRLNQEIDQLEVDAAGRLARFPDILYRKHPEKPLEVFPYFFYEPVFNTTSDDSEEGTNVIYYQPGGDPYDGCFALVAAEFNFTGSLPIDLYSLYERNMEKEPILKTLRRELSTAMGSTVKTRVISVL